jgi:hypothetical protein
VACHNNPLLTDPKKRFLITSPILIPLSDLFHFLNIR